MEWISYKKKLLETEAEVQSERTIKTKPTGSVQLLASCTRRDGKHKMKPSSTSKTKESASTSVATLWGYCGVRQG